MRYKAEGVPLVVFAGKEYGTGSSRDWAAKGTRLLGIRAVIAQSFERIHRSNLVGMGVLPLVFEDGQSWQSLGIKGDETVTIRGLAALKPRQKLAVAIASADGKTQRHRGALPDRYRGGARATTATAASCRLCCATWPARLEEVKAFCGRVFAQHETVKPGRRVSPIRDLHLMREIRIVTASVARVLLGS